MRARQLLIAAMIVPLLGLAGCNAIPKTSPKPTTPAVVVPTIGPGTVMTDALTEAHCVRGADGVWTANGVVKNTTKQTRSFDVNIYVGQADGESGVAQVVKVKKVAAGTSAPWKAAAVQATSEAGPCYIRVRIAT